ncbi:M28 family metallopeptidase [Moheibacter lacus]|uniref:M28 family peptidase n=1 Tax=Moheibacter lacus TaxID=2745851 RepID=A0A838ZSA4_9FLAO|nr:M28 family metallopeptidase [Moheibacter lacus]MBA5629923.1 M28 family peptidase [Moheibacter lacus]
MKFSSLLVWISIGLISLQCSSQKQLTKEDYDKALPKYIESIKANSLKDHLYIFASDEFEGRDTGEEGQKKAANYIRDFYIKNNIESPESPFVENYFQHIPAKTYPRINKDTENVLGFIQGSEKPEEIIVISAHYDHVGVKNGEVYNGADDDGSGSVAILEIANAFKKAEKAGFQPKRSILFLHVTAEEIGLLGSKFYTDMQPVFPLENTVANLNTDMIGRIDDAHLGNENYVYLIGSDKLSKELHKLSEEINQKYVGLELDYTYNDENDPNRFYYRSDHYNFAKNYIPIIFYFNGVHADYHQPSDTPDKINYNALAKRTKLIFATAWELANRENRILVDKK